jgi:hypothetical protein
MKYLKSEDPKKPHVNEEKMSNKKKEIGALIIVFGIIFLIIGLILSFYEIMLSFTIQLGEMGYTPHLLTYPYQYFGLVLILAGIIFLIIGLYLWQIKYTK